VHATPGNKGIHLEVESPGLCFLRLSGPRDDGLPGVIGHHDIFHLFSGAV